MKEIIIEDTVSVIAYARVQTNELGRLFNVEEVKEVDLPDWYCLEDIREEILDIICEEKDSDLLVAISYGQTPDEEAGISGISVSNIIVLRLNYKETLKETILKMDKAITSHPKYKGVKADIEKLHTLYESYLEGFGEYLNLLN